MPKGLKCDHCGEFKESWQGITLGMYTDVGEERFHVRVEVRQLDSKATLCHICLVPVALQALREWKKEESDGK